MRSKYSIRLVIIVGFILNYYNSTAQVKDEISLNGDWKFYTIYGEGSNYLNIKDNKEAVVIENNDFRLSHEFQFAVIYSSAKI